jgi:hypothetical protein
MKTRAIKKYWFFLIPFFAFFTEKVSSNSYQCIRKSCVLVSKKCQPGACLSEEIVNKQIQSAAANPSEASPLPLSKKFFLTEKLLPKGNPDGMNWSNPGTTPSTVNSSDLRGPFRF